MTEIQTFATDQPPEQIDRSASFDMITEPDPLEAQLATAAGFATERLVGLESVEDDLGDGLVSIERTGPEMNLADGSTLACSDIRFEFEGETDSESTRITLTRHMRTIGLHINRDAYGNNTYGLVVERESRIPRNQESLRLEDMPYETAAQDDRFIAAVQEINRTITEEVPKPPRPYIPRELSSSSRVVERQPGDPEAAARTDIGFAELPYRGQDAVLVNRSRRRAAVLDGVGGTPGSEKGARLGAAVIDEAMDRVDSNDPHVRLEAMAAAIDEADLEINLSQRNGEPSGETTVTLAELVEKDDKDYLVWVVVGDSRLYLRNGDVVTQVGEDEGVGSSLYNAIGRNFEGVSQGGVIELAEDTDVVLATDGVTGDKEADKLTDDEICLALAEGADASAAAQNLIDTSRKQRDDKTAVVMRNRRAA